MLRAIGEFFSGWRFPAGALALLGAQELALLALLLAPAPADGSLGFADEFRMWCFGWDPATGGVEWMTVLTTLTSPLFLMGLMAATWWEPLRIATRTLRRRMIAWCGLWAAVGVAGTFGVALLAGGTPATGDLPFPGEALRTAVPMPGFELIDHEGKALRSEELRGRVVLLTAVYSSCGFT